MTRPTRGRSVTRAALYARVSTAAQGEANGVDAQLHALETVASARGWTTTVYSDVGVSGRVRQRPALERMLADVRRGVVDVVVVMRLDRLARSLAHLLELSRVIGDYGCALVCVGQSIDTTTPEGRLMFSLVGAFSEFEADLARERTLEGISAARARGVALGRPRREVSQDLGELVRQHGSVRAAARAAGMPYESFRRALRQGGHHEARG